MGESSKCCNSSCGGASEVWSSAQRLDHIGGPPHGARQPYDRPGMPCIRQFHVVQPAGPPIEKGGADIFNRRAGPDKLSPLTRSPLMAERKENATPATEANNKPKAVAARRGPRRISVVVGGVWGLLAVVFVAGTLRAAQPRARRIPRASVFPNSLGRSVPTGSTSAMPAPRATARRMTRRRSKASLIG